MQVLDCEFWEMLGALMAHRNEKRNELWENVWFKAWCRCITYDTLIFTI